MEIFAFVREGDIFSLRLETKLCTRDREGRRPVWVKEFMLNDLYLPGK